VLRDEGQRSERPPPGPGPGPGPGAGVGPGPGAGPSCHIVRSPYLPEEQRQRAFPQRTHGCRSNRFGGGGLERAGQRRQRCSARPAHAHLDGEEGDASALIGYPCRGQKRVTRRHLFIRGSGASPSPCTGMVTVCPLLAVTVAVAMETTVCPARMAATKPGGAVLVPAV